jgi:hypothetical protein
MRALAFLLVLQSMATGAYIAASADAGALTANWPSAACLAVLDGVFAFYVLSERNHIAR